MFQFNASTRHRHVAIKSYSYRGFAVGWLSIVLVGAALITLAGFSLGHTSAEVRSAMALDHLPLISAPA
ncbi:hypothetical protein [Pelagibacterium montanilacus]|uniref:hypothetical protein n=1 Tax=Pelagibacterium montanilacus TaxID=2185280 RepID=UPI000F8C985A|nr:hypothetical protein [Pelagibacterium montanilacus]